MSKASERFFEIVNSEHRAFDPETLDAKAREHIASKEHLWIALTTYHISKVKMQQLVNNVGELGILDTENLMSINFGCFLCEVPFAPGLLNTICMAELKT